MKQPKILYLLVVACLMAIALSARALAASDKIKIEYVTFVVGNHLMVKEMGPVFMEMEKRSQDKLQFKYRGGPESLNMFAQAPAAIKGATDMVFTSPSFMSNLVRGADMLSLCEIPVADHRKSGLHDYMNEIFQPIGLAYIGMYPREMGTAFYILAKKPIAKLNDFKGLSARGGDWFDGVGPALEITTVSLRHYEEYTALERGIIDFGRMTLDSMVKFRLFEVAKYLMEPPWASAPASLFMNLDKWNSLPPDIQELIVATWYEFAPQVEANTTEQIAKMKDLMLSNGVEITKLDGQDKKAFMATVEKAMYNYFADGAPEVGKKIYKLSHKQ